MISFIKLYSWNILYCFRTIFDFLLKYGIAIVWCIIKSSQVCEYSYKLNKLNLDDIKNLGFHTLHCEI